MNSVRGHEVIERVLIIITTYFVLAFALYFFFAGHNNPGGGFIGGLTTACALALLYLIFSKDKVNEILRFSYPTIISVGILLAFGVGLIGVITGNSFLTQFFEYFNFPFFGEVELTTALPFDLGIYFVVVGSAMVIILNIAEDEN